MYTDIYISSALWQVKGVINLNETKTVFGRKQRQIHRNIGSYYTQSHRMSRNLSRHYTEGHSGRAVWRCFRGCFRGVSEVRQARAHPRVFAGICATRTRGPTNMYKRTSMSHSTCFVPKPSMSHRTCVHGTSLHQRRRTRACP